MSNEEYAEGLAGLLDLAWRLEKASNPNANPKEFAEKILQKKREWAGIHTGSPKIEVARPWEEDL